MKKLFTTFLMMGFALASQATIVVTPSDDGKTLTISADAGDDFNQYYQDNIQNANPSPSWAGNVTKLVLTGKGFTNRDLAAEGRIPQLIEKCTGWTGNNNLDGIIVEITRDADNVSGKDLRIRDTNVLVVLLSRQYVHDRGRKFV